MGLIGSTSFGFAQNTIHDFQNNVLNLKWHCLRQMPQKRDAKLSHNNPCFPCNIAITNFLILHMCEIRFYDVIDRAVHTFTS